ncbi:hypothetical protein OG623_20345 [Streptomyces sp. NBC_01012]|nr:hypothetical protein OG623_20345 [Streptomyces sp. NBC_01012]
MYDLIRWISACLLRRPALGFRAGCHRSGDAPSQRQSAPPCRRSAPRPHLPAARSPYGSDHALDGATSPLVRPYLLASDQEYAQRRRRLALVLAADFGLDLDLHVVGAQGVVA